MSLALYLPIQCMHSFWNIREIMSKTLQTSSSPLWLKWGFKDRVLFDTMRAHLICLFSEAIPQIIMNCGSGKSQLSSSQKLSQLWKKNLSVKLESKRTLLPVGIRGRIGTGYLFFICKFMPRRIYTKSVFLSKKWSSNWWQSVLLHFIF